MAALSAKRERFCQLYLRDFNGAKAYREAGYVCKNDNVAAVGASKLLRNGKVAARLAELTAAYNAELHERVTVSKEAVIRELARLGFADIREAVEWGPGKMKLKESATLSSDIAAAVKKVKLTKEGSIEISLHDKVAPLTRLGDHFGMKVPVQPVKGKMRLLMRPLEAARSNNGGGGE